MAFVKVEKLRRGIGDLLTPVVTMGAYLADGKKHKTRSIMFRISFPLLRELKWEAKDGLFCIVIHEGTDTNRGFLQFTIDNDSIDSRRISTPKDGDKHGISTNVTVDAFKHYVLNECPISAIPVAHTVDGSALIIECPDWLRYNPQSVPEPEPTKVTPILNREQRRTVGARIARNLKR